MDKIKIINVDDSTDYFEIPWDWLPAGTQGLVLNDLEASANRSTVKAKLSRVRSGEVPSATLDIDKCLTQAELYPLFRIVRPVAVNVYYFEKYANEFITRKFYVEKINPPIKEIPEDNTTDNIVYDKFTINFVGYEDVNA